MRPNPAMRLEFPGPSLERLVGKNTSHFLESGPETSKRIVVRAWRAPLGEEVEEVAEAAADVQQPRRPPRRRQQPGHRCELGAARAGSAPVREARVGRHATHITRVGPRPGRGADLFEAPPLVGAAVEPTDLGSGRMVFRRYCPSTLYQIHEQIRCLHF
jgi:hypothetical protein